MLENGSFNIMYMSQSIILFPQFVYFILFSLVVFSTKNLGISLGEIIVFSSCKLH
jgi:hypothetical protein